MTKRNIMAAAVLAALCSFQPAFAADEADTSKSNPAARAADQTAQPAVRDPAAAAAGAAAAREAAAREGATDRADTATMNKDQDFLMNAASGNLFEVRAAQVAQKQAQDDSVKQLAQRLAQDHQKAQQQLQQAAQAKNMQVPQELSPVHQAKLQKLQKYQGRDFDKHFLAMQAGSHLSSVLMYRDAAQTLQDQGLKQYATQTLPHLEQHYQAIAQAAGWTGEARTAGSHEHGTGTTGKTGTGASGTTGSGTTGSGTTGSGTTGSGTTGSGTSGSGTSGSGTSGSGTSGGATGGTGASGSGAGTGAGTPGANRNTTDNPPGTSR